jgi:non-haem dioxygenase in morphine synthesis N-terminal
VSRNFPVIDLEAVREPQVSIGVRREIAHQVASACEEIGFFAVTGHGVPGAVIADLVAESYAFFDLPLAEKLAVRRPRPEQNRGYIAPGEERLARLRGDETPPEGAVHDRSVRLAGHALLHGAGCLSELRAQPVAGASGRAAARP